MLTPLRHIAELAANALNKKDQDRTDNDALRTFEGRTLELPAGLELEWLGVSGYRMTYEGQTLFIDPYVSRVSLRSVLLRRAARPDASLIEDYLGAPAHVVGVLVGHTHFDHALDAPAIARRFGCKAYGSSSLAQLMRLHGVGEQAVEVEAYHAYELGPFKVSFTPSAHSKLVLGLRVPYDGELTCEHLDGLSPAAYRCGQVWGIRIEVGGTTFYHQGSANLIDDALPAGSEVDVFLAGVAGRGFTPDYWERILVRLQPRVIVPTHYDDFFAPLARPMGLVANVKLAELPDEIERVSRDFELVALARVQSGSPSTGLQRS
ncbi:MAG TPA: MBL fold metallo-hydrolase [Solirubrobacteraceae bacterium]|nr:MBL fold metallo-hydrolase [Solirubrobacteraceae bacterium]